MFHAEVAHRARFAVWLVGLFVPAEHSRSSPWKLLEQRSPRVAPAVRGGYWPRIVRIVTSLAGAGFRRAPWSTTAAVLAGLLLIRLGFGLPADVVHAVLQKYRLYEQDLAGYRFWVIYGTHIGRVIVGLLVGGFVAVLARGREMVATIALGLALSALAGGDYLYMVARTGHLGYLWRLPWLWAISMAAVVGGIIVRTHRFPAAARVAAAGRRGN